MSTVSFLAPYEGLKDIMSERKISQGELAEYLGIDRATFNLKINRSRGRDFELSEAIKIGQYLNIELQQII